MNVLIWIAVALGILWALAVTVFKMVGLAIHLTLVVAALLVVAWAAQKVFGGRSGGSV